MIDPFTTVTLSLSGLAGLGMVVAGGLAGWRGWLQLKRVEIDRANGGGTLPMPQAGARIEIADLKERIRKLEIGRAHV